MYGLVKLANIRRDANKAMQERGMSEDQFHQFTNNLKQQYGHDTDYLFRGDTKLPQLSYAIPNPEDVEKIRQSRLRQRMLQVKGYNGSGSTLVNSIPVEETILHETGHILDPHVVENAKKAQRWGKVSALSSLGATLGAPNLPEKVPTAAKVTLGAGLAGLAGVATSKSHKYINQSEDAANDFVKKHWANELGSMEAAEKRFAESTLPAARKTYGGHIGKGIGTGLKSGLGMAASLLSKEFR
jgi:hypothetical protein